MPFYGPWIQGPDEWVEQVIDHNIVGGSAGRPVADAVQNSSASFLTASDADSGSAVSVYPPLQAGWSVDPTANRWHFTVGEGFLGFLDPGPFVPTPDLPPRAVGVEWEGGSSGGTWLGGYELWLTVTGLSGSTDEWDFFNTFPRRSLAGSLTPLLTLPSPSVGDHVEVLSDGSSLILVSGEWRGIAHGASHRQMYAAAPSNDAASLNPAGGAGITYTMTQRTFTHPPRHRFVYDTLPPLRQYPRDDALAGAPRQGNDSRSIQASARQGWSGTYR